MKIDFECKECNMSAWITKAQAKAHTAIHKEMKVWFDEVLK